VVQAETAVWAEYYRAFISAEDAPAEPMSDLAYPIIDEIDRINVGDNVEDHTIVGLIGATFYWRSMIRYVIPPWLLNHSQAYSLTNRP
jgi:hypothetical protein